MKLLIFNPVLVDPVRDGFKCKNNESEPPSYAITVINVVARTGASNRHVGLLPRGALA